MHRSVRSLAPLPLAGLLIAAGCDPGLEPLLDPSGLPEGVSLEEPTAVSQPIINGVVATDAFYAAVVSLHQRSSTSVSRNIFCSGTLITDDVVLTAAHCLDAGRRKPRAIDPLQLAIHVGPDSLVDGAETFFPVSETWIHPSYNSTALLNDIGLIRLASPVPSALATPVPALPASLGFSAADVGMTLNFAGFGRDENGAYNVRLEVDGVLGGLGCAVAGCSGVDDPATQISYEQPDAGPCSGDSGGPAFVVRGGQSYVGGMTSWGDSACTLFGVSTRADAFEAEIAAFVGTAPPPPSCTADGVCEAGCASDPDCGSAGTCGDGVCGSGESCDGRGSTSSCSADCPGKTGGRPSGRYCWVEGACQGPGC